MTVHQQAEAKSAAAAADVQARLMLLALCLIWGFTWPMMKVALNAMPPLSMRVLTASIGALTLLAICVVGRHSLRVWSAKAWTHIVVAAMLNVVGFSLCSAFAQIAAATSRVAILTYAMPIWVLVLAWAFLGERPTRTQGIAITLCAVGIGILIAPLATTGVPLGLVLAIGSGFSWAAGTVYVKWARIQADPVGVTSWQMTIAFFVITPCMFFFDGGLHVGAAHTDALLAVLFVGAFGNAIAYAMWFSIVQRVPALTATLGIVAIPVIGVAATMLIIGERPTAADTVGFAFILAASLCAQIPRLAFRRFSR